MKVSSRVLGIVGFVIILVVGQVEEPNAVGMTILFAGAGMMLYALVAGIAAFVRGVKEGVKKPPG